MGSVQQVGGEEDDRPCRADQINSLVFLHLDPGAMRPVLLPWRMGGKIAGSVAAWHDLQAAALPVGGFQINGATDNSVGVRAEIIIVLMPVRGGGAWTQHGEELGPEN